MFTNFLHSSFDQASYHKKSILQHCKGIKEINNHTPVRNNEMITDKHYVFTTKKEKDSSYVQHIRAITEP